MIDEGAVAIRDFGSKNGTLINGERVIGESELKSGDVLQVGHLKFELLLSPTLGGKTRPKVTDIKDAVARTAAGAGASDDLDVSQWLTNDKAASIHETRPLDVWQATATQDTVVADVSPDTSAETVNSEESDKSGKKKYGKLPPIPKAQAKDSRDAAADTLRKLFKGR
jgi:pSer/pThr/pTyr-binding forkhead associated (FHA) protein